MRRWGIQISILSELRILHAHARFSVGLSSVLRFEKFAGLATKLPRKAAGRHGYVGMGIRPPLPHGYVGMGIAEMQEAWQPLAS